MILGALCALRGLVFRALQSSWLPWTGVSESVEKPLDLPVSDIGLGAIFVFVFGQPSVFWVQVWRSRELAVRVRASSS